MYSFENDAITATEGSMQVMVPSSWAGLGDLRLPKVRRTKAAPSAETSLARLDGRLFSEAMTPAEHMLAQSGHIGMGWERDTSFWIWLARLLFLVHGESLPELHRDPVASCFVLRADQAGQSGALIILLPRGKTWGLVRQLPFPPETLRILPPARECYRVFFRPDKSLEISPSLRLEDGRVEAGMKFVVFSQYTGMLELIEGYLRRSGIGFASLKGNMTAGRRQKMIDAFNTDSDCRVFCASLLAGGVGIDLTGAEAVIHYDRWWNPAREEQATARVHRMGQKKVVQVFRLITTGTLEEKIHRLIARKRELAAALIQEDEASIIKRLGRRELAELFRLTP